MNTLVGGGGGRAGGKGEGGGREGEEGERCLKKTWTAGDVRRVQSLEHRHSVHPLIIF